MLTAFFDISDDVRKSYCCDQKNTDDQQDNLCIDVSLTKTYTKANDDECGNKSTCDITFTTCRGDTSEYCHCDGIHFKSVTGCGVCTV